MNESNSKDAFSSIRQIIYLQLATLQSVLHYHRGRGYLWNHRYRKQVIQTRSQCNNWKKDPTFPDWNMVHELLENISKMLILQRAWCWPSWSATWLESPLPAPIPSSMASSMITLSKSSTSSAQSWPDSLSTNQRQGRRGRQKGVPYSLHLTMSTPCQDSHHPPQSFSGTQGRAGVIHTL